MRYPRTTRIFRGQLDVAPVASVFFVLLMFVLLASLVYTPGVRIDLPDVGALPGTDKPSVTVAVDAGGQFFFEYQMITTSNLAATLSARVRNAREPLSLVVRADKNVPHETMLQLELLARAAGIQEIWQATLPRLFDAKPKP